MAIGNRASSGAKTQNAEFSRWRAFWSAHRAGWIVIFVAGNLLIGGRVFDRQLLARILERDTELTSQTTFLSTR